MTVRYEWNEIEGCAPSFADVDQQLAVLRDLSARIWDRFTDQRGEQGQHTVVVLLPRTEGDV